MQTTLTAKPQNATLLNPNLAIMSVTEVEPGLIEITYTSTAVAPFTWLTTSYAGHFSNNGMLSVPGETTVVFEASQPVSAAQLQATLSITSLYSVYN